LDIKTELRASKVVQATAMNVHSVAR